MKIPKRAHWCIGTLIFLLAGLCQAQEEDDSQEAEEAADDDSQGLGGRAYIGIDTQLFGTSSARVTVASVSPTGVPTTSTQDYSTTQIGLGTPSWGFSFGYAPGDYFAFGANLMFESATVKVGNAESQATGLGFAPNVKVLMSANQDAVPYAFATVGYQKLTTEGGGASNARHIDGAMYGGGLGVFLLPNPYVSFEPSASVRWTSIKDDLTSGSVTALGFYLGLTLSAWFWEEERKPRDSVERERDYRPPPDRSQVVEPTSGKLNAYLRTLEHELQVSIDPSEEEPQFLFTLLTPVTESPDCGRLHMSGTEGAIAVPTTVDTSLDRRRQVITASVPYQAMKVGVSKTRSQLEFCGRTWKLTAAERQKLLKLVALFRNRARSQGTFDAAAAVPIPSSNAASEPEAPATNTPED
jgi:hypothetical protein